MCLSPTYLPPTNQYRRSHRYRLGWDYPLHLGVTEAGEGEDGRMKSAIGAPCPYHTRTMACVSSSSTLVARDTVTIAPSLTLY